MFWFTGACTLTGPSTSTNTEMRMNTQNTPSVVSVSRLFSHSYDSWLSSSDVEGEIEEPPHSEKPWRVGSVAHMQKNTQTTPPAALWILVYITGFTLTRTLNVKCLDGYVSFSDMLFYDLVGVTLACTLIFNNIKHNTVICACAL